MIVNEKIGKIKLELLKEEFIKQIKDSYTLNLSMVLLEEFENLQQENARLKDKIDMAIKYYETNQQECVIGRTKDDKLIKDYYLPAQCSKKLLDILKEN